MLYFFYLFLGTLFLYSTTVFVYLCDQATKHKVVFSPARLGSPLKNKYIHVKTNYTIPPLFLFFLLLSMSSFAQTSDEVLRLLLQKGLVTQAEVDSLQAKEQQVTQSKDKTFYIGSEIKPRFEYRDGYRFLREDSTVAGLQVLSRVRLNIGYEQDKKLKVFISIQDARTWGQYDPRSTGGTIQLFEGYAEPFLTPKITARIGRQKIMLDNQRLFAQNDWRPNAGAHDGVSFHYVGSKIQTSVYAAFNQSNPEAFFNTSYQPAWSTYKYLGVYFLKYQLPKNVTFTTINALDGFEDKAAVAKNYNRYTNGGRLEWEEGNFYATFSGYYQWGQNSKGAALSAWYIQPEVRYSNKRFNNIVRLGAEVLSGSDNTNKTVTQDNSFVPLYGVAHRFNGYMDFFTSFPQDLNNAGLINPYLFVEQKINSKFSLHAHFHLFYAQNKLVNASKQEMSPYVGFENDYVLNYKPNKFTELEFGFSYANMTASAAAMKEPGADAINPLNKTSTGGNPDLMPTWGYLQIKINPELFRTRF